MNETSGRTSRAPSRSRLRRLYAADEVITFSITVKDYEGDWLNVTVDFGDGTNTTSTRSSPSRTTRRPSWSTTAIRGADDPYVVTVTVEDGVMQFHSSGMELRDRERPGGEEEGKGGDLAYGALGWRSSWSRSSCCSCHEEEEGEEKPSSKDTGGMEGMKPPVEPPAT